MDMVSVESSQISEVGYDPETMKLHVRFVDKRGGAGSLYEYDSVPQATYDALVGAESVGRYFGANVKYAFQYRKLA